MSTYYMLECWGSEDPEDAEPVTLKRVPEFDDLSWISGALIKQPVPTPLKIEFKGGPDDIVVPMFDAGIFLLRDDVIDAIQKAGVDNLQLFDANLVDTRNGKTCSDFKAVNIVGVVAVASLAESNYEAYGSTMVDVDFNSLTIDGSSSPGLLMFRLAECVTGVVVHEKVKYHVEKRGISGLNFVEPADWIG